MCEIERERKSVCASVSHRRQTGWRRQIWSDAQQQRREHGTGWAAAHWITHTRIHTHKLCGQENSWEKCVCVCLKAFHLMHASAFSHAGMFAFALSYVPLCVCTGACVCVRPTEFVQICMWRERGFCRLSQTDGVCLYLRHPPPLLNLVWRQEVEEVWGGEEISWPRMRQMRRLIQ